MMEMMLWTKTDLFRALVHLFGVVRGDCGLAGRGRRPSPKKDFPATNLDTADLVPPGDSAEVRGKRLACTVNRDRTDAGKGRRQRFDHNHNIITINPLHKEYEILPRHPGRCRRHHGNNCLHCNQLSSERSVIDIIHHWQESCLWWSFVQFRDDPCERNVSAIFVYLHGI
jgi:hypothetical protein